MPSPLFKCPPVQTRLKRSLVALSLIVPALLANAALAETADAPGFDSFRGFRGVRGFRGWQGLRVIEQEGQPQRMIASDLDGDGRDELIVVNTRQARLEIYRHLPPHQREAPPDQPTDRPNELPMAEDFERVELPLEHLPVDVLAHDLDGDGRVELVVLLIAPRRVEVYRTDEALNYERVASTDLLPGDYAGRGPLMLLDDAGQTPTLLVSMNQGIQALPLQLNHGSDTDRASWLEPKQAVNRAGWWLSDLDGDGDRDLIEWAHEADRALRWYERIDGRLTPPQTLHDKLVDQAVVLESQSDAGQTQGEVALLGGIHAGLLRRYRLGLDEPGPLGRRQTLAVDGTDKTPWCATEVEGKPTLIAIDPAQPRLTTAQLTDAGWVIGQTYPIIADVQQITPLHARPGTLLLRTKDAGRLYTTHWDGSRFIYPAPLTIDEIDTDANADKERAVLSLGTVGKTTWWTQRIDEDVVLCRFAPDAQTPDVVWFKGLGKKVQQAVWLGGRRLMVLDQYARQPKLVTLAEDKPHTSEPAHLKAVKPEQLQLFEINDTTRVARLTDGVLQWLGEDLQPTDQVMLPEGARLINFIPLKDGNAWALEAGGRAAHRLKSDDAGILRVATTHRLPGGQRLIDDPTLGLLLIGPNTITRLSPGQSRQLELIQSIDSREGRPSGVKEATIHRVFTDHVIGRNHDELILCDDMRHQLTLLARNDVKRDGDSDDDEAGMLEPVLSWPVFEDAKYPYGYDEQSMTGEPRHILALDIDGDGKRDLAMLCHDRLILYLAEETK